MASSATASRNARPHWRHAWLRPRLYAALALAVAVAVLLPEAIGPMRRAVIGWDCGTAFYLVLILIMVARATPASMHRRAQLEDATRWAFLALMAGAALFSMFALLGILHDVRGASGLQSVELTLLAGGTILLSWLLAHTVFAMHYAHGYYADRGAERGPGLLFPGERGDPDYWDFLYFSFVIGMTCQVSDVQVAAAPWRRLVMAHGIVSFLFNTVVLALSINLLAGLL
jgi:uncharacterized membrane protein